MSGTRAQPDDDIPCSAPECLNPARHAGLCWGHRKRRQRGQPLSVQLVQRGGTERDRLIRAFNHFADVADRIDSEDSEAEWRRAVGRVERAIYAYRSRAAKRGPRPRPPIACGVCGRVQNRKTCSTCRTRRLRAKKIGLPLRSYLATLPPR